jgi:hypothetical protein
VTTPTIVFLTETQRAREHGMPWTTIDSARWDYRHRKERGTAAAFVKVGRRIGVYPDVYHSLLRERAERDAHAA